MRRAAQGTFAISFGCYSMLPELFLHIGTTKTGSTSIQAVLDARRRELPPQGAYWPKTHGGAKRHLLLAAGSATAGKYLQWIPEPVWQGMEPAARMAAYREEFVQEIQALPKKKIDRVIISAEQFSLLLRKRDEIQRLHDYLAPMFSKMTVIIYLRRQDSHYSSMYAQNLRMGNLYTPDIAGVKLGYNQDYDYLDLVTRWAEVFGESAMMPRLFERTSSAAFDVVEDFFALCRIRLDAAEDEDKRERNPSMNLVGQQVLLRAGELLDKISEGKRRDGFMWNRISDAVTRTARGKGWLPTQDEASAFMARFEATNEAVRARYFPERKTLFAMDFSKLPVRHEAPDPGAVADAACAALIEAVNMGAARERAMSQQMAKLAEATGDPKRSIAALMHVLRTDARNIGVRLDLAEQHLKLGDLRAAAAAFKGARRIAPDDPLLTPMAEKLAAQGVSIAPPEEAPEAKLKRRRNQAAVAGAGQQGREGRPIGRGRRTLGARLASE